MRLSKCKGDRMGTRFFAVLFCIAIVVSTINTVHATTALTLPGQSNAVEDTQPGWTWSGMVDAEDDGFSGGTAHAGGPGTYCAYTFTGTGVQVYGLRGPDIIVDGHHHKLGKLRITIDGHVKGVATVSGVIRSYSNTVGEVVGLTPGLHVLVLEPLEGWGAVDYVRVVTGGVVDSHEEGAPAIGGKAAIFDGLDNWSQVFAKSPGMSLDIANSQYLAGDASRANRATDTREYVAYRCLHATGFIVRVYTKQSYEILTGVLRLYVSTDGGATVAPVDYVAARSFAGGGDGGWTGYDIGPKSSSLPAGTDTVFIVMNPGTGVPYDPEIGQVAVLTGGH